MSERPHIVISMGDPCGIGPELLLSGLPAILAWCDVTVVGCRAGMDLLEGLPGAPVAWRWTESTGPAPAGAAGSSHRLQVSALRTRPERVLADVLWLDPTPDISRDQLRLGQGSAASGRATVEAVRVAALMALSGVADALVTLPMAKSAAHMAGYDIPGHTEFLQALSAAPTTRMAFVSPRLNVVLHTVHQSLRSVVETLDAEAVAETLAFSADQFIKLTGKLDLRVALCALNPHAGEQGAFGDEESILEEALVQAEAAFLEFSPAVEGTPFFPANAPSGIEPGRAVQPTTHPGITPRPRAVGQRGMEILSTDSPVVSRPAPVFFGPLPSDSVFQRASRGEFDLVVALYHDQGLIPVKLLEPTRAVNLTLGLPFIRTSPDHGTAFDKAGQWIADAQNFLEAAALAVRLAGRGSESLLSLPPQA